LVFAVLMTAGLIYTYLTGADHLLGVSTSSVKQAYGFGIGAVFAGVVGTGFYPLMGNRVWCRFGCPLAAYLGLVQRFKSRFRITTNGGQCISCGNCSTYCEQGIDVRWYAQRGQNIVRSSCVGCGVCSAVCPRGVLNLENGPDVDRSAVQAITLAEGKVQVLH
jgi:polyferredoxin